LIRYLVRLYVETFYQVEAEGLEKIPRSGGAILACNHLSNADPPVLECCAGRVRPVRFLAKKELFDTPLIGWVMRTVEVICIDRRKPGGDLGALRAVLDALKKGHLVALFPEGTRSRDGRPGKPQAGIGFLAAKSGVPVITARIMGSDDMFGTVKVKIGGVCRFEAAEKADYGKISEKIMSDILAIED